MRSNARWTTARLVAGMVFALACGHQAAGKDANPSRQLIVAGWTEHVQLSDFALRYTAKLDTGADTASINVTRLAIERRQGKDIARFMLRDDRGRTAVVSLPVIRKVRIKRIGAAPAERPVVRFRMCLGGRSIEADFTLAPRVGYQRQVLIGRNVLAGRFLVDSARAFLTAPGCTPGDG